MISEYAQSLVNEYKETGKIQHSRIKGLSDEELYYLVDNTFKGSTHIKAAVYQRFNYLNDETLNSNGEKETEDEWIKRKNEELAIRKRENIKVRLVYEEINEPYVMPLLLVPDILRGVISQDSETYEIELSPNATAEQIAEYEEVLKLIDDIKNDRLVFDDEENNK